MMWRCVLCAVRVCVTVKPLLKGQSRGRELITTCRCLQQTHHRLRKRHGKMKRRVFSRGETRLYVYMSQGNLANQTIKCLTCGLSFCSTSITGLQK